MLAEGFAANLSTLKDLQRRCRLTNSEAAKLCGVPLRTYRRWSAHGNPHPGAVRLLALLAGFVPFEGWQGWEFDNGCLFPPGYAKNGLTPGDFFALVFQRQLISAYRNGLHPVTSMLPRRSVHDGLRQAAGTPEDGLRRSRAADPVRGYCQTWSRCYADPTTPPTQAERLQRFLDGPAGIQLVKLADFDGADRMILAFLARARAGLPEQDAAEIGTFHGDLFGTHNDEGNASQDSRKVSRGAKFPPCRGVGKIQIRRNRRCACLR